MTAEEPTRNENAQRPKKPPFQFGLKHLLAAPVWLALLFALEIPFGVPGLIIFFLLNIFAIGIWRRSGAWIGIGVGLTLLLLCLLPVPSGGPASPRPVCANNLKQIALALNNYHDNHGCFPPAYIGDENGRPMHRWRVLILPYLEQQPFYDQYRFDEPWDGPNNSKLADIQLEIFHCPSEQDRPATMTSYVAVVGPDTAWPESNPTTLDDFTDGTSNTLLVVEVANSGIHWMEPRDLHVVQMVPGVNPKAGQGISSLHKGGANVCFADVSVRFLPETLSRQQLEALLTIAGGESIDPNAF